MVVVVTFQIKNQISRQMERRKILKVVRSHGLQLTVQATDRLLEAVKDGRVSDIEKFFDSIDKDKCTS